MDRNHAVAREKAPAAAAQILMATYHYRLPWDTARHLPLSETPKRTIMGHSHAEAGVCDEDPFSVISKPSGVGPSRSLPASLVVRFDPLVEN